MQDIASLSKTLTDQSLPIQDRFRALFTLRSLETNQAAVQALIDALAADSSSLDDDDDGDINDAHQKRSPTLSSLHADALFRHEVAFALGQMRAKAATATLISVLKNQREHGMTRHECAEALGAIADETSLEVLRDMQEDSKHREVRETASLAFGLVKKTQENEQLVQLCSSTLGKTLRSETVQSALLKHEICYVLGQLREDDDNEIARKALFECLEDPNEHAMVRHEAAEAIGSRGGRGAEALLRKYLSCEDRIVSESCEVALDMLKENEEGFVALE